MKDYLSLAWQEVLKAEFIKPYFLNLIEFLNGEAEQYDIYPLKEQFFCALNVCSPQDVRVVIIGQDPYHTEGMAEGLSFSVPKGVKEPPSLRNIKQEILADLGRPSKLTDGSLLPWAEQGVLLLNAVLSVRRGEAASHRGQGWEMFTDAVIDYLNAQREGLVFILWGNDAKRKGKRLDTTKHCVLMAGHPSPLSVRYFRGCKHFSQANAYLQQQKLSPINW